MLKYLIILLDDTSVSFCHCDNPYTEANLISIEILKAAVRYAMEENLIAQFVYPKTKLTKDYLDIIDSIDSEGIVPVELSEMGNVVVWGDWGFLKDTIFWQKTYILKTSKADLFSKYEMLFEVLPMISRLNVVITDIETFQDADFEQYKTILEGFQNYFLKINQESEVQLNLITDRIMLETPNHCNAGVESVTIAPNGKFYVCPAFYYCDKNDSIGDLSVGLDIKNAQLYKLEYAPLCRECDAFQCKRCVWLNRKTTGEVNVPSHEQCVVSHLEREASRRLLTELKDKNCCENYKTIEIIDYLDPFDKKRR